MLFLSSERFISFVWTYLFSSFEEVILIRWCLSVVV